LPTIRRDELDASGWDDVDDHPRVRDAFGRPSFLSSPPGLGGHRSAEDFTRDGRSCRNSQLRGDEFALFRKLDCHDLHTAGCVDSMVNHYTPAVGFRSDDAYTPGDQAGFRPD